VRGCSQRGPLLAPKPWFKLLICLGYLVARTEDINNIHSQKPWRKSEGPCTRVELRTEANIGAETCSQSSTEQSLLHEQRNRPKQYVEPNESVLMHEPEFYGDKLKLFEVKEYYWCGHTDLSAGEHLHRRRTNIYSACLPPSVFLFTEISVLVCLSCYLSYGQVTLRQTSMSRRSTRYSQTIRNRVLEKLSPDSGVGHTSLGAEEPVRTDLAPFDRECMSVDTKYRAFTKPQRTKNACNNCRKRKMRVGRLMLCADVF
jgi:hypothetical protein